MASSTNNLFQKLTCVDFQLGLNFSSTIKIAFHFLNWLWLSFCCVLFFIQLFFFIIPQQKQSQSSSLTLIQQRVNVSLWPNIIFLHQLSDESCTLFFVSILFTFRSVYTKKTFSNHKIFISSENSYANPNILDTFYWMIWNFIFLHTKKHNKLNKNTAFITINGFMSEILLIKKNL